MEIQIQKEVVYYKLKNCGFFRVFRTLAHMKDIFFCLFFFLVCNISMYQVSKSKRRFFPSNL